MNKEAFDSSDGPGGRHSEVGSYDEIYFRKQWLLSLVVLGVLFFATMLATVIAFMQGVIIRQVINSVVAVILLSCIVVSYYQPKRVGWSVLVAVVFLHVIGSSGFISNGGVSTYAASLLPVIPIITILLLGKRAAVISLSYVLFLGLVSGALERQV